MATMQAIRGGLEILAKYVKPDDHCIDAQHDIIYASPDSADAVSAEDKAALEALGWFWDTDCSWAHFT